METIRMLQAVASPALDDLMLTVTNLGSETAYIALLVIAYLGFGPRYGGRLGIYLLAAFYLNGVLKGLFDTPRPFVIDPSVLRVPAAEATAGGAGFPSGHAQGAATFWGVAARYARTPWFTVAALVIIALVSLSRIYLGVHMPIDVIGGLVLGGAVVALVPLLDRVRPNGARALLALLAIAVPLAFHLLAPTVDSAMLLGGASGFLVAPLVYAYEPPRGASGRVVVAALGLGLVFVALFGSSALLPEEFKRHALGGYARYLLVALVGLVGAPALAGAFGKGPRAGARQA